MPIEAEVYAPWTGAGTRAPDDPFRCLLEQAYPECALTEIAGQSNLQLLPEPNLSVFRVWCDAATFDALAADARFQVIDYREV